MAQAQAAAFKPGNETIQVEIHDTSPNPQVTRPSTTASRNSNKTLCCRMNSLFERAARLSWLAPRYDAPALEQLYQESCEKDQFFRLRAALVHQAVLGVLYLVYAAVSGIGLGYVIAGLAICFASLAMLALSLLAPVLRKKGLLELLGWLALLPLSIALLLEFFVPSESKHYSNAHMFSILLVLLFELYLLLPIVLYRALSAGILLSLLCEALTIAVLRLQLPEMIAARIALHLAANLVGAHLHLQREARCRSSFWKRMESALIDCQTAKDRKAHWGLVTSLMPPKLALQVMKSHGSEKEENPKREEAESNQKKDAAADESKNKSERFRTLMIDKMSPVSVVFADIVGFTKMSSNKTAPHLVFLLNDLFGRFDKICEKVGCEKIATLGDCYYCVSGCPEPKPDHAICCVEMGLGMCQAIQEFDKDHNESVNMRVGVHTGDVLCGIVGSKRFKFDVFSNDVTLANMMESTGFPGRVHISESTKECLNDTYELEEGPKVQDIRPHKVLVEFYDEKLKKYSMKHEQKELELKTYFVICKKGGAPPPNQPKIDYGTLPDAGHGGGHDDHEHGVGGHEEIVKFEPILPEAEGPSGTERANEKENDEKTALLAGEGQSTPSATLMEDVGRTAELVKTVHDQWQESGQLIASALSVAFDPAINPIIVQFNDSKLELDYQRQCIDWLSHLTVPNSSARASFDSATATPQITYTTPRISLLFDAIFTTILFLAVAFALFVGFSPLQVAPAWIIVFFVTFIFQMALLVFAYLSNFFPALFLNRISAILVNMPFVVRNLIGFVILSLPIFGVFANFSCAYATAGMYNALTIILCYAFFVGLINYLHFSWTFSALLNAIVADVAALIYIILFVAQLCGYREANQPNITQSHSYNLSTPSQASTTTKPLGFTGAGLNFTVTTTLAMSYDYKLPPNVYVMPSQGSVALINYEIIPILILLLILFNFWNRQVAFYARRDYLQVIESVRTRNAQKAQKEESDWLLQNIIPFYITDELKRTQRYSRNLKNCAVIFANIANFYEFYEEQFEGGREFLRVLNELFADMEELFDEPKFKDVEKIKTIGACYMGASGLNMDSRLKNKDPNSHLYQLMDFALGLFDKIKIFNDNMLCFTFKLKIGYNVGEVTAGVIGSTKLLYDIWGDTVNVASRMYSTGVPGRIQVAEETARRLSPYYDFSFRGKVFVKGKGDMSTYLLVKKKPNAPRVFN